jgi:2Fe-2S ferredoxin
MESDQGCTAATGQLRKTEPEPTCGDALVHVEPLGVEVSVKAGTSLMRAAQEQGLYWPTVCNGDADCGTCFVAISAAEASGLPPISEKEARGLQLLPRWRLEEEGVIIRLACQLRPRRNLVVQKRGVRRI